jgi:uncharacterized cofD-like protein
VKKNLQKNVVVIGGGTGSFVLLSGLKHYPVNLTAIVPVTDDGGSTGRLRDEFGFLPVGDMRQCLAALAPDNSLLRQLLTYRFSKGQGLKGHNLGNLILTALEDMLGSEPEAISKAAKIFRLQGQVLPISDKLVKLKATYSNNQSITSEHKIETNRLNRGQKITNLTTQPQAQINAKAAQAIKHADIIILAPGDLFNSLIANLVILGTTKAINNSKAKIAYVVNLMTLNSQTDQFSAKNHLDTLESYLTKPVDHVIINSQPISSKIIKLYQKLDEYPVKDDLINDPRVIRKPLLASSTYQKSQTDSLKRSLLRHDPQKLAKVIVGLI